MTKSLLCASILTLCLAGCKTVEIRSTPVKAELYQEGSNYAFGSTPYRAQNISSPRTFELRKSGYVPKLVTIGPNSPAIVEVELEKEVSGKMLVEVVESEQGTIEVKRSAVHAEKEVIERSPNVTAVRRLTDLPDSRYVQYFCLSPDGKTLIMEVVDEVSVIGKGKKTYSNLWAVDALQGGGMRRVTQGKYFDRTPTISPDGKYVYFSANRSGKFSIWRLSLESLGGLGLVTSAATSDRFPSISPDSKELLYTAEMTGVLKKQLWSMPVTKGLPKQLREGAAGVWSPDGTKVLYSEGDTSVGKTKIWTMAPDGSLPTQVTTSSDYDDIDPCWSPNGSSILFASDRGVSQDQHNFDIWIMNSDGSNPKQLTTNGSHDDHPIISPDGKTVYFRSNRGFKWDVWVMEIATEQKPE